jgi:ankyrin repeat protein
MSPRSLPQRPNLDQLRRQAKELRDAARAGDAAALAGIRAQAGDADPLTLAAAQLAVAREHGFASWSRLKAEVEARTVGIARRVDVFLRASVTGQNGRAARMLDADPGIAAYDFRTAVVLGEAARVREQLARDPAIATRPEDRSGWPPLLGVCSSRWHRIDPRRAKGMVEVAGLLLDAGADPDTTVGGRPGQPTYCSTLFGAAGCADNPAITGLLLERGATPDDHTIYLSAFHDDLECLRLLLAHSAGMGESTALAAPVSTGDTEGVRLLLDAGADPARPLPADLLAENVPAGLLVTPLYAAIEAHCPTELIELLLVRGADPYTPGGGGRSPYQLAVRQGRTDLAERLARHGAREDATAVDRFLGACLRGDRAAAERLLDGDPGLLDRLSDEDRAAIVDAADGGRAQAVRLMLDLGFPVGVRGGADGATALHSAAGAGSAELVRLLIERGGDIEAGDTTWGSSPLAWATVGSGLGLGRDPNPDWVATVQALIDAGASLEGAWIDVKPPSPAVAELLRAHGVTDPAGEEEEN